MSDSENGPREYRVQVAGRETRIIENGSGPPVVLVHGLGLTAGVWRPHVERLAEAGYRAIAPDLPGFGRSEGPMSGLSVRGVGRWLVQMADTLALTRPAWVGHSVGAQQVVRMAASEPDRAGALVLAAPTGRTGHHRSSQLLGLATTAFRERPGLVADVIRRYLGGPLSTIGTWLRSDSHSMALDAPRVTCPVLLVRGARDPVVQPPFIELLHRLLTDAEVHQIEEAAHAVAIDPVPPFVDATVDFLDRRYRPSVSR